MTNLIIEVGKTYVTYAFDPEEPNDGTIVRIVGIVDPSTVEYELGFRFVGHNGKLYTEYGYCKELDVSFDEGRIYSVNNTKVSSPFNIDREAYPEDLKIVTEEFARIDLEDCEKSDKFIRSDDPRFFMGLGQIYVDRRGIFKFVNKVYRFNDTQLWGPDGGTRFISNADGYEPDGRENSSRMSMYDIIFQKIG